MQTAEKLSITLPADMVRIIRAKVEGGTYASNSEVIREAMRPWIERERHFATLEAIIDRSIADVEAGRVYTTEQARERLAARFKVDDDKPGT